MGGGDGDGWSFGDEYWDNIDGGGDGVNGNDGNSISELDLDPIKVVLAKLKFDTNIADEFKEIFKVAFEAIKGTKVGEALLAKLAAKSRDIKVANNAGNVQANNLNVGMFDSPATDFLEDIKIFHYDMNSTMMVIFRIGSY